ncbi:hypothetical protein [Sphingomonas yantingensis]|uniref:OmpA-like domain-containing protein n=1 Tax=Sphingomonas yantingensis TaxID=1241761 RepID=A0A7W9ASB8_9SPHN|nr:hypothetical protein [Sphingomonas yantingensis]MBB5699683.1 hypothetical protein [Sphingomonas yantingensis]
MPTPLAELFDGPLGPLFRDIADRFTTDGVTSTPFTGGVQHSGTLKSVRTDPIDLGFGELELPGVTAGVPFRMAEFDVPDGRWHLDLVLDGFSLKLKDLHGADFEAATATTPRRLIRRATDTAVVISGEATIRFAKASADTPVILLFVENRSAADPLATTGAVVQLRCTPRHFFFGSSQFAMTLADLLFDASDTFSPDFVIGQGQTAEWVGFAVAEATFYAPPNAIGRGGFSGGVRNLLIGSPRGVQGEFEVQWGRTPLDPATFVFTQTGHPQTAATGSGNTRLVAITGGQDEDVAMTASFVASQPPDGGALTDWGATWRWPDGSETTGDVATGQVRHGQVLRVVPEERITGRPVVRHPEVSFRFVAAGEVPEIDVVAGASTVANVVHVAGPAADIAALSFAARSSAPTPGTFHWKVEPDGTERTGTSVRIPLAELDGDAPLVLREVDGAGRARVARVRLQVAEGAGLLIGSEGGVVAATAPASPITPAAVEGTYDLTDFRARGRYAPSLDDAAVDAARAERVDVPAGGLALVTIPSGGAAPTVEHDRHVEILFEFATGRAIRWGADRPAAASQGGDEAGLQRQLLQWAANYPGARFLVVGRCDDLGTDSLNATLAHTRRDTVLRFLTAVPTGSGLSAINPSRIDHWGEQDGQPGSVTASPLDDEEKAPQRLVLATDAGGAPITDRSDWITGTSAPTEPRREPFRRVDIYAVGGTPAAGAVRRQIDPGRAPDLRRMLMPGATVDPAPAPVTTPESDYRVKLLAAWDKPSGDGWKDLIPSKAEFEYAWSPDDHPLPSLGGQPVTLEVLTVYGNWRHDDASGFTRTQLGIRSDGDPDGLVRIDQPNLVAALALGPVLLSGVKPGVDTVEAGARIAALAAGIGFAQVDLGGGPLLGTASKAAIKKLEATAEIKDIDAVGDDYKISLTSDYSTVLHVNTGALGLRTQPDQPVKFRYKDVGIVFDQSKTNIWEKIAVAYPTDALSIEDPGRWRIEGVLGELLRAVETALGQGSLWIETRFAFALSIGVVEVTEAVIRVTFNPPATFPDISLRGLVARIDIPATLKGEGRLRIEDPGGVIKAGIDIEVVPLQLKASAAFAMAQMTTPVPYTFVNLYAKVQFPVGIPLGPSGAALHGFIGQTVINGTRDVASTTDIVAREIGWWRKNPEDKYKPLKDQHALGIGAVVGTLPDASFSLSATGMIVIAFPDPEVIFAVEIALLSVPVRAPKEKKDGSSAAITGLIVIDDTAVALAAQARYEIPEVLRVVVPFAAYFPYSGIGTYVRIGSDGQAGRSGEPVTLTLLPSTLNLQAYAYLMIEQDGLPNLGGDPRFSFQGFSVGFGAGAGLEWKAGPIRLSASVKLLAGMGTDPLLIKAGIFVKGELDLVVVSVSARGEIILTYQAGRIWMDGEFCGEVDLFFFSLKGCVTFRIGSDLTGPPPPPLAPVVSIFLTDRGGRVMGEALADGAGALQALPIFDFVQVGDKVENHGVAPSGNHTVWADTAPLLNFRHYIADGETGTRQFERAGLSSGAPWFGSNRLKYAYLLNRVRVVRDSDGAPVTGSHALKAGWQTSPARQPGGAGPALPSGAEALSLKLFDWQPWDWALPMADGGESAAGDPAATVGNLCQPVPAPARACLFGQDARGSGGDRIGLFHETPPPGPYPSFFTLRGRPGLRTPAGVVEGSALASLVAAAGALPLPGSVVMLAQPVAGPQGPLQKGYRLPAVQVATPGSVATTTLPWIAAFDRSVRRASLLMLVCDGGGRGDAGARDCYRFAGLPTGKSFAALDVPRFKLEAMRADRPFTITDRVDLTHSGGTLGSDRQPDILIAEPGLILRPSVPVRDIEVHVFRGAPLTGTVKWRDAAGGGDAIALEPGEVGARSVRISAAADLVEIAISVKGGMLFLTEICTPAAGEGRRCLDFEDLSPRAMQQGRFALDGVTFTALDPRIGFALADNVDAGAVPPVRGSDRRPELRFPDKGVELAFAAPVAGVDLGVWSGAGPVSAIALDARGNVLDRASDPARDPVELRLRGTGIVRVIVSGGTNEAALYHVCRHDGQGEERCVTFGVKAERGLRTLEREGLTFTPRSDAEVLTLGDVATAADPVVNAQDGLVELILPGKGLSIALKTPVGGVTLFVLALRDARVEAVAYDAAGAKVASADGGGAGDTLARLVLAGAGIARIDLMARGRAALTRVCLRERQSQGGSLIARAAAVATGGTPIVTTRQGDQMHHWPSTVVGTIPSAEGRSCRLIRFDQPAALVDVAGFDVVAPAGLSLTLLSVCAIDSAAALAQAQDAVAQGDLAGTVGAASGADPAEPSREVLLEPGETYRIEVDWSWQAWTSNAEGTDSPDPPVPGAFTPGTRQVFRFRVAAEELAPSGTQDGLNEFKFDPRDLVRYLGRIEPADGRDVVFTDDPLWVHFNAGHVEALADRYDRELVLEVKRTDPPPQVDDAAMTLAVFPDLIEVIKAKGVQSVLSLAEQRINAALADAPCLPDAPAVGGQSIGGRWKLVPNAMYDFNLLAVRKGAPLAARDPIVVNATRFKTSRYANPAEMLAAMGFATSSTAPIAPEELLLADAAVLPTGALSVSDRDLADALRAIGADTLPLPGDRPRAITLWQRIGGSYRIAGFLIDSPEPMRREGAVLIGDTAVDTVRCKPDRLTVGGTMFEPVRATLSWTRVLFRTASPVVPADESELAFRLLVLPGGTLTGKRVLRARPLMLDIEGF